jgi:hypothetical protein
LGQSCRLTTTSATASLSLVAAGDYESVAIKQQPDARREVRILLLAGATPDPGLAA